MNITIYDEFSLIGPAIACWLMEKEEKFGPKFYRFEYGEPKSRGPKSWKNVDPFLPNVVQLREYAIEIGQVATMQVMENETLDEEGYITFLDGYYESFGDQYKNIIWSNWFGSVDHRHFKFKHHDKLIICDNTPKDVAFGYAMISAYKPITSIYDIDRSTEFWRMDHVEKYGEQVGDWLEKWHKYFDKPVKEAFLRGELKFFAQLNNLHWSIFKDPLENVRMLSVEEVMNYVQEHYDNKKNVDPHRMMNVRSENPDALFIGRDWFDNIDEIEAYLGIKITGDLRKRANIYKKYHNIKLNYFNEHIWPNIRK